MLAFTDPAGDSPTRFCVVLNKAYSVRLEMVSVFMVFILR